MVVVVLAQPRLVSLFLPTFSKVTRELFIILIVIIAGEEISRSPLPM